MTEFVDQLPQAARPGVGGKDGDFLRDLHANPGRWAVYPSELKPESMSTTRQRLRKRGYEAAVRQGVLYVRRAA